MNVCVESSKSLDAPTVCKEKDATYYLEIVQLALDPTFKTSIMLVAILFVFSFYCYRMLHIRNNRAMHLSYKEIALGIIVMQVLSTQSWWSSLYMKTITFA
jgi:hypothetical protein